MTHHEFSPSSLERRMLCPGSYRLERALPPEPASEDAAEGTLLHEAVATGDYSKLTTEEQRELAENCRKFADEATGGNWRAEVKLRLFDDDFSILTSGTADVVGENGAIIDWKFGRNPVEYAADNIQLAAYAAALLLTKRLEKCTVYLVQPRLRLMTQHTFTAGHAIRESIRKIINECKKDDAPLCPGEKQCRYCRAAANGCPALIRQAEIVSSNIHPEKDEIAGASGEKLTAFLLAAAPILKAAERTRSELRRRCLANNGYYLDWELKPGRKTRSCDKISELHLMLESVIETDRFLQECSVSVAGVENLYAERLKASGQVRTLKAAKELFAKLTEGLITSKQCAPTLEYVPGAAGAARSESAVEQLTTKADALGAGDSEATSQPEENNNNEKDENK